MPKNMIIDFTRKYTDEEIEKLEIVRRKYWAFHYGVDPMLSIPWPESDNDYFCSNKSYSKRDDLVDEQEKYFIADTIEEYEKYQDPDVLYFDQFEPSAEEHEIYTGIEKRIEELQKELNGNGWSSWPIGFQDSMPFTTLKFLNAREYSYHYIINPVDTNILLIKNKYEFILTKYIFDNPKYFPKEYFKILEENNWVEYQIKDLTTTFGAYFSPTLYNWLKNNAKYLFLIDGARIWFEDVSDAIFMKMSFAE